MNIINYYQKGIYKPPYKIIVIGDVHVIVFCTLS